MSTTAAAPSRNEIQTFWPEMGQKEPNADLSVRSSLSGNYIVWTRHSLKPGVGLKFVQTLKPCDLVPQAQHKVGMHVYNVTPRAMNKLLETFTASQSALL